MRTRWAAVLVVGLAVLVGCKRKPTADGYLLYSVGPNGRDDGGRGTDDQPPGDDLVVRMPPR